jgi:hypothetical protein
MFYLSFWNYRSRMLTRKVLPVVLHVVVPTFMIGVALDFSGST